MSCAVSGYTFLSLLGRGSFGVVRKVKRDVDGKVFALKDIQITHRMSDIDRYEREVNSHRSLPKHSNILEFIDYTRDRQYMHIVLEYCELGNLEEYVLSRCIDFNTALSFMVDMSRGLNHLHSNGIVHRDIKPENVLLAPGKNDIPRCKISDFGVANMSTYQMDQIRTEFGTEEEYFSTICGTPVYLAPEVTERRYTNSCDVFSLGVVFYILFSTERTSGGRLAPWAKNGTVFYRAKDQEIQEQVKKYVTDEKVCELMYSMLRVDYHDRTTAAGVEEKLMEIALSDDEVFLVACFLIGFLLILLLLPLPLCVLCLVVFIIMAKEVFPKNLINTSIVPS